MVSIAATTDEILVHYTSLNPALIDIINGMKRSYMFMRIENFDPDEELTTMSDPLLEFLYRLRDLHQYMNKYVPDYIEDEAHPAYAMYELYQSNRPNLRARRRAVHTRK